MEITRRRLILGVMLGIIMAVGIVTTLVTRDPRWGLATGFYAVFLGWFTAAKLAWVELGIQGMVIGAAMIVLILLRL